MKKDPVKYALWGMVVGNIEQLGILPVSAGGEAIAKTLEGKDVLEKLSQIDGENNYEILEKADFRYVVLKECPFNPIYKDIPPWGERSMRLVADYNKRTDGGGALHPLCLLHKGVRKGLRVGIISLACRSAMSGKIEISEGALEQVGISKEEILQLLQDKACIFVYKIS